MRLTMPRVLLPLICTRSFGKIVSSSSRHFACISRKTTTRDMVSFIDFYFHFLANSVCRPKLRPICSLYLLMLFETRTYVTQILRLGYLCSNLPYIAQTSREVGISFCRHKLWDRLSHNQEEGWGIGLAREKSLHYYKPTLRISIFITWGVKEVHSIRKKGLG